MSSPPPPTPPRAPAVTSGGYSAFVELVRVRLLEFCREPEALFWVYGFPLIMILSLGVAFRGLLLEVQLGLEDVHPVDLVE